MFGLCKSCRPGRMPQEEAEDGAEELESLGESVGLVEAAGSRGPHHTEGVFHAFNAHFNTICLCLRLERNLVNYMQ